MNGEMTVTGGTEEDPTAGLGCEDILTFCAGACLCHPALPSPPPLPHILHPALQKASDDDERRGLWRLKAGPECASMNEGKRRRNTGESGGEMT